MQYEINYLMLQSKTEDLDKIRKKVRKTLEARGAKIVDELVYQKRKLAYKIKHEQYGFYTVYRFRAEQKEDKKNPIDGIKKDLDLSQNVARYIIVRADELPELQKEIKEAPAQVSDRDTIKQEDVAKIISSKKAATKPKPDVKPKKDEIKKEDVEKELRKEETRKKDAKGKKDDASLDDLDKKLDEILNI